MKNSALIEKLSGKSIALVGPAGYLADAGLGATIDQQDIVVRINRGCEISSALPEAVGRRTDLLYSCLVNHPDNAGDLDCDLYKRAGVQKVIYVPLVQGSRALPFYKDPNIRIIDYVKIWSRLGIEVVDVKVMKELYSLVKTRPNTGFAALFHLLSMPIKSLYLTGFSFYLDDFIQGYKAGCDRESLTFSEQCFMSKRHEQEPQWRLLKRLHRSDERLSVDPILKKILSMPRLERNV